MEKFQKRDIAPIARRSSVLKAADKNDRNGIYNVELWKDEEKQIPSEDWIPEQIEDYFDAMSPINDQLEQAKGWWILEIWPIKVRIQPKSSEGWVKKVAMNLGRFRPVQEAEPNLHWSVQQRMHDHDYKIRTRLDKKAAWRIVV